MKESCARSPLGLRRAVALAAGLTVALGITLPAAAKLKSKSLYKGQQQPVGLALAPGGTVHFSWQAKDYTLHHAWVADGKKRDEVVDATSDCGWWSSIAVDSAGRPHIAYHAERMVPSYRQVLVYAHFDGMSWQIEELGDGGYATDIAIDADDEPHIVHVLGSGAIEYLHRDDAIWERETPPGISAISFTPLSLALDSDEKPHVVFEDSATRRPVYVTEVSDWEPTELATSMGPGGSLALDALDRPHVVLPLSEIGTIRYSHFDGMQWVEDDVYDPNDVPAGLLNVPEGAALSLDPDGRPQLLFATSFVGAGGSVTAAFHAYYDGIFWAGSLLKKKNATRYLALASDAEGVGHGVYSLPSGELAKAKYLRAALHDLAGEWTSLEVTEDAGTSTVFGVLHVRNEGDDKSPSTRIALYLSDDAALDEGDLPFAYKKKVGAIKPGLAKDVKIKLKTEAALAGKHLIAVLDPFQERFEGDRTDDAIPGALPP
jgi:hypothetical protein